MEQGFHVIMADIQSCGSLANDFRHKGYMASHVKIDLAMSSMFPAIANKIHEEFGRLDVLVNNASILADFGKHPSLIDEDTYRRVIEVNQIGPFLLTRALTPLLKNRAALEWLMFPVKQLSCHSYPTCIPLGEMTSALHINRPRLVSTLTQFCSLKS
ncbi:short-chain dehydrogenase/reductase SDR [Vibrio maritimus]|uniref:Short-chain dehydrogenase/reductase SDR n=1 Tax=Vibrio maritimus TaxID=990268 RepID=A0A090RW02_9VIBR|nr:short-chain dehydrogenase/reductase SDR [Vibrio maritimus]